MTAARLQISAPAMSHGGSAAVDCPWGHTGRVVLTCADGVLASDDSGCQAACTAVGRSLMAVPLSADSTLEQDSPVMPETSGVDMEDAPWPDPAVQATTTQGAAADLPGEDGAVSKPGAFQKRTSSQPIDEDGGIVLGPEALWLIAAAAIAFRAALAAAVLAIKHWGWGPRSAGEKDALRSVGEVLDAVDVLTECHDTFSVACRGPEISSGFPDTFSHCASGGATACLEALGEQYRAVPTEEAKVRVLEMARSAVVNSGWQEAAMLLFDLLQEALLWEKGMCKLQEKALGHVADMATGAWEVGCKPQMQARQLLLRCYTHPSPPVRVRAIALTAGLLRSSSAEDVDTALQALQETFTRLSRLQAKEDCKRELAAVLATYKEAMGEDPHLTEVEEKVKAFMPKVSVKPRACSHGSSSP